MSLFPLWLICLDALIGFAAGLAAIHVLQWRQRRAGKCPLCANIIRDQLERQRAQFNALIAAATSVDLSSRNGDADIAGAYSKRKPRDLS